MGVRSDLREEQEGVLQFFVTLFLLFLIGEGCLLCLIVQEPIKQILILETQLLVHCRIAPNRNHKEQINH